MTKLTNKEQGFRVELQGLTDSQGTRQDRDKSSGVGGPQSDCVWLCLSCQFMSSFVRLHLDTLVFKGWAGLVISYIRLRQVMLVYEGWTGCGARQK